MKENVIYQLLLIITKIRLLKSLKAYIRVYIWVDRIRILTRYLFIGLTKCRASNSVKIGWKCCFYSGYKNIKLIIITYHSTTLFSNLKTRLCFYFYTIHPMYIIPIDLGFMYVHMSVRLSLNIFFYQKRRSLFKSRIS